MNWQFTIDNGQLWELKVENINSEFIIHNWQWTIHNWQLWEFWIRNSTLRFCRIYNSAAALYTGVYNSHCRKATKTARITTFFQCWEFLRPYGSKRTKFERQIPIFSPQPNSEIRLNLNLLSCIKQTEVERQIRLNKRTGITLKASPISNRSIRRICGLRRH